MFLHLGEWGRFSCLPRPTCTPLSEGEWGSLFASHWLRGGCDIAELRPWRGQSNTDRPGEGPWSRCRCELLSFRYGNNTILFQPLFVNVRVTKRLVSSDSVVTLFQPQTVTGVVSYASPSIRRFDSFAQRCLSKDLDYGPFCGPISKSKCSCHFWTNVGHFQKKALADFW